MSKYEPVLERPGGLGGTQEIYRFPNGYGASVLAGGTAYTRGGTYEVGVVTFDADGQWHLTYETPVTDDVLGYLSEQEKDEALDQIAALPAVEADAS